MRNKITVVFIGLTIIAFVFLWHVRFLRTTSSASAERASPMPSHAKDEVKEIQTFTKPADASILPGTHPDRQEIFTGESIYERHQRVIKGVDYSFGMAIKGLRLPKADEQKLRDLLAERDEVAADANAVVTAETQGGPDLPAAIREAQSKVDEEIARSFGPEIFAKVSVMLAASTYIREITYQHAQRLAAMGTQIQPEQVISLAGIFLDTYGPVNYQPDLRAVVGDPQSQDLTAKDIEVVQRSLSVLSTAQAQSLKASLVQRNLNLARKQSITPSH